MNDNQLVNINMQELGKRLQRARKKKGLTQADAGKVIGAVRTTITAIEKGERKLKPHELINLAEMYGIPVSELVKSRPKVTPFDVQFRAAIRRSDKDEEIIENIIYEWEKLCQNYLELEELIGAPLAKNYPPEYKVENIPTETAGESIALQERSRLGLGDGPISFLRDVLEQEVGLRIFYLDMPHLFSEMFNYDDRLGGCMAININHPEERRRWSMAHGYLHFLAHRQKPVLDYVDQYARMPESEKLAESFARYFLMPTSGIVKRFSAYKASGKFTPTDLCTLAHYYEVSVEALVYRLEGLNLLPTGTWDNLKSRGFRVRKAQEELGFREIPQRADKIPLHYQHLAIEALDQELITEGRFSQFLGADRLEARRIAMILRDHSSGMDEASSLDLSKPNF